ncbi:MAG: hypothetical protein KDB56_10700, partial [Mycobacterium sp.]|nr:hypothetical protein [Mycobacterium sp.]
PVDICPVDICPVDFGGPVHIGLALDFGLPAEPADDDADQRGPDDQRRPDFQRSPDDEHSREVDDPDDADHDERPGRGREHDARGV